MISEQKTAQVAVVIVAYNSVQLLPAALDSVAASSVLTEVVVVDNSADPATAALLTENYPKVTQINPDRNVGFGTACNLGANATKAPHILLLNPDAALQPDALASMLAAAGRESNATTAAFTARVLLHETFSENPDGSVRGPTGNFNPDPQGTVRLVNSTGNLLRTDGWGVDRGWLQPDDEHHPPEEVFGMCGAAVLIRRDAFEHVGGFSEELFLYYEDTDLSWRLRLSGWQIRYVPDAVVTHVHAASSGEGSTKFHIHNDRSRLLMLAHNATIPFLLRCIGNYLASTAGWLRAGPRGLRRAQLRSQAFSSFLLALPKAVRQRRNVTRLVTVPRRQVQALLVSPAKARGGAYRE